MTSSPHAEAATLLLEAHASGVPIEPLTERYPGFDLDDAYEVQSRQVRAWVADGRSVVGHKVGLTSAAMQRQLGVDRPDHGVLLGDRAHRSGDALAVSAFISPRVEPEVAFVLAAPLAGPGVTAADALAAVGSVRASLEVIDSRITDWRIRLVDTVADNASFGAYVLAPQGVPAHGLDLGAVRCRLDVNGEEVATGTGDAVLGSPLEALAWLANTLGARGVRLEAGHVVLPGSITAAFPVAAGDTVTAAFTGVGAVTARFT